MIKEMSEYILSEEVKVHATTAKEVTLPEAFASLLKVKDGDTI